MLVDSYRRWDKADICVIVPNGTFGYINVGVWVDITSNSTVLAYDENIDAEPSTDAAGDRLATDAP